MIANTLETLVDPHAILEDPPGKEMVDLAKEVAVAVTAKHKGQAQGTANIPRVASTRTTTSATHL